MNYETLDQIFARNFEIRQELDVLAGQISEEEANVDISGEWTIAQLFEHIALVNEATAKICSRLLRTPPGSPGGERSPNSPPKNLYEKLLSDVKISAPEIVQPKGESDIRDSMRRIREADVCISNLRSQMDAQDLTISKFPHPFFGELTIPEWLMVMGGHEQRHARQIKGRLVQLRGKKSPG